MSDIGYKEVAKVPLLLLLLLSLLDEEDAELTHMCGSEAFTPITHLSHLLQW